MAQGDEDRVRRVLQPRELAWIGFTNSSFSIASTPSRSLIGSQANCGVSRKTGSIRVDASLMLSIEIEASMPRVYR